MIVQASAVAPCPRCLTSDSKRSATVSLRARQHGVHFADAWAAAVGSRARRLNDARPRRLTRRAERTRDAWARAYMLEQVTRVGWVVRQLEWAAFEDDLACVHESVA